MILYRLIRCLIVGLFATATTAILPAAAKAHNPETSYLRIRLMPDALETELKERARARIREGGALQRAGKHAEALEKFRESRRYYPRSEVDEHIRKLEEFLKK